MIIFYNKKTGAIIGNVAGRVHSEDVIKNAFIKPSNVSKDDIVKYIVPFVSVKPVEEIVPVKELRVVDDKTKRVEEVVVGKKKVRVSKGMRPDVPFADLILDIEGGKKGISDCRINLETLELELI